MSSAVALAMLKRDDRWLLQLRDDISIVPEFHIESCLCCIASCCCRVWGCNAHIQGRRASGDSR